MAGRLLFSPVGGLFLSFLLQFQLGNLDRLAFLEVCIRLDAIEGLNVAFHTGA